MKAYVIEEPGGPEQLILREVPTPSAKPGWSLVRVRGFGVNHSEIFTRQGFSPSVQFPRILGIECVGVIEQTTDPARLPVGRTVVSLMGEMGRAFDGGYAQFCLLPNEQIYPVDTELGWEELAALPETYYTAYGSLAALNIEEGHCVLVRGATSGVGVAFMRLLRGCFPGMRIVGSTRKEEKGAALIAAGFSDFVVDEDNRLRTDERFDRVLELVGPSSLKDTLAHVGEGSVVCVTGLLGGTWTLDFEPLVDQPSGSYLTCFESSNITQERLDAMVAYVERWGIDVSPERVFPFEELPEAHRYLEGTASYGKTVVMNSFDDEQG